MLKDKHGRQHNYLRISLTEKCNLRCTYCMPEDGVDLRPSKEYMSVAEVVEIAKQFVELGVDKIRLTGGEPLVFKGFSEVLEGLAKLPVSLSLTTNGLLLTRYFDSLEKAGVETINISIDSLEEEKFNIITRRAGLSIVWEAIHEAIERGFRVKLNVVVIKDFNEDEIINFVNLTKNLPIDVRFIEFMPFDGNRWQWDKVVSEQDMLQKVGSIYSDNQLEKLPLEKNYISRNYQLKEAQGSFGFISTMTHSFCGGCNRIRLTADGHIKNCLFSSQETDILSPFRAGQDIKDQIIESILTKHEKNGGIDFEKPTSIHDHRSMISIGG